MNFFETYLPGGRHKRLRASRVDAPYDATSECVSHSSSLAQPQVRLVTYAWGREHIEGLLNYTLASVLAPGNLPALSKVFDCTLAVVTEEAFFEDVRNSPTGRALQQVCPLKLISLDDLIAEPWQYGMTITHSLFRGFEDLGPAMIDTYLLFLNADFVLADGCYGRLIDRMRKGESAILSPSYCTIAERIRPILNGKIEDCVLSVSARELAAMILKNCHNTIRAKTVNQRLMEYEYTDQFYWRVDHSTLIGHQLPISLIAMRPERHVTAVNTFWDWGMVYEFCPSKRITAIADPDEFLMLELRPEMRSIESIRLGRTTPRKIAKRTTSYITKYQVDNAKFQLLLHSGDLPKDLAVAEKSLNKYVGTILQNLPAQPIDCRNHKQWLYHKKHYRRRVESSGRVSIARRRKGEPAEVEASPKYPIEEKSLATRVAEVAHPYKNARNPVNKSLRYLAESNPSILVICDAASYLLSALDLLPGIQTHFTPAFAVDGLSSWPKGAPGFDLCLIEVSDYGPDLLDMVDAAIPRLRQKAGRILLLWHDRLGTDLRSSVTEIMKVLTLRQIDFDLDYTISWSSAFARKLLRRAARPPGRFGLNYPLKWFNFSAGASLAVVARLISSLGPQSRYLTDSCTSLAVALNAHEPGIVRPSLPSLQTKALLSRIPAGADLYLNTQPEFTKWVVKSGLLHEAFVVVDVGVLGGENPRWHFLGEHLVLHGFDAIKEVIEELHRVNWDLKWDRSYHWLAIGKDNGEKEFFVDPVQPTRSSLSFSNGLQRRLVPMRSLDSLIADGAVPHPKSGQELFEAFVAKRESMMGIGIVSSIAHRSNQCA
jgi:hypothetical protein